MLTVTNSLPETGEQRFEPPLSPSLYEQLSTCPRQAAYRRSKAHPVRSSPAARLGDAFHTTLEQLASPPPEAQTLRGKDWRTWVVQRFEEAVAAHRAEATQHPRECFLPWSAPQEEKLWVLLATLATKAEPQAKGSHSPSATPQTFIEAELRSADGLLRGRPDLIERQAEGLVILDHKTGDLSAPEKQARYQRQCLLYAALTWEALGEWPTTYRIVQAVSGEALVGKVIPEEALALADEVRTIARTYQGTLWRELPAAPDEKTCASCSYRPWCPEFWSQHQDPLVEGDTEALSPVSFEASLSDLDWPRSGPTDYLTCRVATATPQMLTITLPKASFPELPSLALGTRLRLLDLYPNDSSPGTFRATAWSEIFIMAPENSH